MSDSKLVEQEQAEIGKAKEASALELQAKRDREFIKTSLEEAENSQKNMSFTIKAKKEAEKNASSFLSLFTDSFPRFFKKNWPYFIAIIAGIIGVSATHGLSGGFFGLFFGATVAAPVVGVAIGAFLGFFVVTLVIAKLVEYYLASTDKNSSWKKAAILFGVWLVTALTLITIANVALSTSSLSLIVGTTSVGAVTSAAAFPIALAILFVPLLFKIFEKMGLTRKESAIILVLSALFIGSLVILAPGTATLFIAAGVGFFPYIMFAVFGVGLLLGLIKLGWNKTLGSTKSDADRVTNIANQLVNNEQIYESDKAACEAVLNKISEKLPMHLMERLSSEEISTLIQEHQKNIKNPADASDKEIGLSDEFTAAIKETVGDDNGANTINAARVLIKAGIPAVALKHLTEEEWLEVCNKLPKNESGKFDVPKDPKKILLAAFSNTQTLSPQDALKVQKAGIHESVLDPAAGRAELKSIKGEIKELTTEQEKLKKEFDELDNEIKEITKATNLPQKASLLEIIQRKKTVLAHSQNHKQAEIKRLQNLSPNPQALRDDEKLQEWREHRGAQVETKRREDASKEEKTQKIDKAKAALLEAKSSIPNKISKFKSKLNIQYAKQDLLRKNLEAIMARIDNATPQDKASLRIQGLELTQALNELDASASKLKEIGGLITVATKQLFQQAPSPLRIADTVTTLISSIEENVAKCEELFDAREQIIGNNLPKEIRNQRWAGEASQSLESKSSPSAVGGKKPAHS